LLRREDYIQSAAKIGESAGARLSFADWHEAGAGQQASKTHGMQGVLNVTESLEVVRPLMEDHAGGGLAAAF